MSSQRDAAISARGGRADLDLARHFAVVVHDVAPVDRARLEIIVDALSGRVGGKLLGAVVPCWHGLPLGVGDSDFVRLVKVAFGEVLQHGYTHRQLASGLISLGSGWSNELSGLSLAETRQRLVAGRAILRRTLGITAHGFIPPAWQVGQATLAELASHGFRYLVGFHAIQPVGSPPIPLATWSWDWGIIGALGWVGECYGSGSCRLRAAALPCVAVHPADVSRGYLPRITRVIDRLLDQGRTPITFTELAS